MNITHPTRRTVISVASALALAMTATAGTAVAAAHREVLLEVDGVSRPVSGFFATVDDALSAAGVRVGAHDLVAPAKGSSLVDGDTVVVRSATAYDVKVDGESIIVWSTADSVDGVLDSVSTTSSVVLAAADRSAVRSQMPVVSVAGPVPIAVDGQTLEVEAEIGDTADALLQKAGVTLGELDTVDFVAKAGAICLKVTRIVRGNVEVTTPIAHASEQQEDPNLYVGETEVRQEGVDGSTTTTYFRQTVDGRIEVNVQVAKTTTDPVTEIIAVGTKEKPAVASHSAAVSGPVASYSPASAQGIAQQMVAARGWSDAEFSCLVSLWNHESGWRTTAGNASGAYGIPQALPGSKMASAGPDWQTDAATQITWGLGYISGRYGTPCGALGAWQNQGWY